MDLEGTPRLLGPPLDAVRLVNPVNGPGVNHVVSFQSGNGFVHLNTLANLQHTCSSFSMVCCDGVYLNSWSTAGSGRGRIETSRSSALLEWELCCSNPGQTFVILPVGQNWGLS